MSLRRVLCGSGRAKARCVFVRRCDDAGRSEPLLMIDRPVADVNGWRHV